LIGVVGAGDCDERTAARAEAVGAALARAGCVVVTGGLGGVMQAASRGAREAGGRVVGILPGDDVAAANAWVEIPIATGLGEARNALIAATAQALVAIGGGYGTLSEIALARRRGKRVVSLGSWEVDASVERVSTPEQAVARVLAP